MANQFHSDFNVRFWSKVNKTETCWLFTSSLHKLGYGTIQRNRKLQKAHRVSWELHFGEIPQGQCVLHKCDVRNCVNPDHLFLGTQQENIADMVKKNRQSAGRQRGEQNPMSKLKLEQVNEIRDLYFNHNFSQHYLARLFSVAPMTINRIVNNKLWRVNE